MKKLNKIFINGLILVMPVTLTFYLLFWLGAKAEGLFAEQVKQWIGSENYLPGFGLLLTVLCIFFVGLLVSNYLTGKIITYLASQLSHIPLVKAIYNPLKDFIGLFNAENQHNLGKVVMVEMGTPPINVIGVITREGFHDLPLGAIPADHLAVYVPYSYIFGGITLFVPKKCVRELNIPVDLALRSAITGWVKGRPVDHT